MNAKDLICTAIGAIGGAIAAAFGGWNAALLALIICMAIDYFTGVIVALVFHRSPKSDSGGLNSSVGFKGLLRKIAVLLIVVVANQVDILIGTTYVRDAVVIGFCANEIISVLENAGLMGIPIPSVLLKAIDLLKNKGEKKEE